MKKASLSFIILLTFGISQLFAQGPIRKGEKQLNFGVGVSTLGIPVYLGMDFGIHENISLGPIMSFRTYVSNAIDPITGSKITYTQTAFGIGFNGDFHFNNLLNIPREFDVYAGISISYFVINSTTTVTGTVLLPNIGVNPHVGGRYNFNPKWSVQVQVDAGTHTGAMGGLTFKF
ncbi:MAG: hypothetical protein OEW67_03640 [Cyclobacteriaceae bacterium]|nr:hypothetical protein [Cyclobacteriaceae bacterium]